MTTTTTAAHGTSSDKLREALSMLSEAAKDKTSDIQDLLAGKYKELRTNVGHFEKKLIRREQELMRHGRKHVHNAAKSVDKQVRAHQWETLGWVVVGGLVVGYMLGRRE